MPLGLDDEWGELFMRVFGGPGGGMATYLALSNIGASIYTGLRPGSHGNNEPTEGGLLYLEESEDWRVEREKSKHRKILETPILEACRFFQLREAIRKKNLFLFGFFQKGGGSCVTRTLTS